MSHPFFRQIGSLLVRTAPRDEVPYAIFEDALPTRRDLSEVRKNGFGIHLVELPPNADLNLLVEDIPTLTHLGIVGVSIDTRPVEKLRALKSLELSVVEAPATNLANLENLEVFTGLLRPNSSVLRAPRIREAEFQEVSNGFVDFVPASLKVLHLYDARKTKALPPPEDGAQLETLVVDGAHSFDLSSLLPLQQLRILSLERVRTVLATSALNQLNLREIGLINCRQFDSVEALAALPKGTSVTVVGRSSKDFANVAAQSAAFWNLLKN